MAIVVSISSDNMEAVVEVDEATDAAAILRALTGAGVVHGIDAQACNHAALTVGTHVVARGNPPIHGQDGRIEMAVEFHRSNVGVARGSGSIDFHERGSFTPIEKGQLIARNIPPTPGIPGKNVRGINLAATPGTRARLSAGKNTRIEADGEELRATIAGDLRMNGDTIEVLDMIRVAGNVDFAVGSIDCEGPVRVEGDLLPGFHIRAGGDVWIGGVVESAEVSSRGDIAIAQGVLGGSRVQASGHIRVGYTREAYLESAGSITINRESVNSTVVAGDSIHIPGDGRVVGGRLLAGNAIDAGSVNFVQGVPTILAAGVNPLEELRASRLKTSIHRANSLERRIGRIKGLTGPDGPHDVLDKILEHTAHKREGIKDQLTDLDAKKAEPADCRIQIRKEVHPGVSIRIRTGELTVRDDCRAATFYYDSESGQVVQI
jgi:uncharacterized protein (DUF342 family)